MKIDFTNSAYTRYLGEHRIMGTRDAVTGEVFLPPRPINPSNYTTGMEWFEFTGNGALQAFTIVSVGTKAMRASGYDRQHPYCSGIVRLEEGPVISALILGVDVHHPETIRIGMPLKAVFVDQGEGEEKKTILAFEPA